MILRVEDRGHAALIVSDRDHNTLHSNQNVNERFHGLKLSQSLEILSLKANSLLFAVAIQAPSPIEKSPKKVLAAFEATKTSQRGKR